jgi:histidine triad (HIT) family protein
MKTEFLHEDDKCVAFNDIHPKAKIHLLIVPKKHIPAISEMGEGDEKIMGHLILTGKNLAEKIGVKGYKLQFNVGKDGGQEVFHIHMHLMAN